MDPVIGHVKVGALDGDTLDSFYAELRRCRDHCSGKAEDISTTGPIALTMVTGARRGEQCGLRWKHIDLEQAVLTYERSIGQDEDGTWDKDTKQHQQRRNALDPETVTVLAEHRIGCEERAAALGLVLTGDEFVFSAAPDGRRYLKPSSVGQRYGRLAARLGIKTSLHKLRHYSAATELIKAGVDIRTVAGRLGHGGGGATTLRVYTAWVSEADQRASLSLHAAMPARPVVTQGSERVRAAPTSPYEKIAVGLYEQIARGEIEVGGHLPTVKAIAATNTVANGTAARAIALLKEWGLVEASPCGDVAGVRPRP